MTSHKIPDSPENYYLPGQLEQSIGEFVEYYNHASQHPSVYMIEEKRLC
jgi:hypothetical protein